MGNKRILNAVLNSFGGVFLSLITSILIIRLLTVEDRGELQLYLSISHLAFIIGSFGIPFSLSLFEAKKGKEINAERFILLTICCSLVAAIPLSVFYEFKPSLLFVFFVIANSMYLYVIDRTKNIIHIKKFSLLFIAQPFVMLCLMFIFQAERIEDIVLFYILSYVLANLIWFLRNKKPYTIVRYKEIRVLSLKIWFNNLSSFLTNNIDKFLILKVLSLKEVGVYMALFSISSIISKLSERLSANMLAYFQTGNNNYRKSRYILSILLIVGSPVVYYGFYFFGDFVITITYGDKYLGYSSILSVLSLSVFIASISWILTQELIAKQYILLNVIRTTGSSVVFIISVYIFNAVTLHVVAISYLISCVYRFILTYVMVVICEKIERKT